jgi:hypothetical protein
MKHSSEAVVKKVRVESIFARVERNANSKLVARIRPEMRPTLEPKRDLPIRHVRTTASIPKKAAGSLTEKEVNPCQR